MTSYTETTETASIGEGKRNRKTQALSALLSATALGVFLEGCASPTPAPVSSCERSGDNLCFLNANGINDFSFARTGDNNEDVIITVGDESNTIMGFVDNVYTLYYGSGKTELGKLYVGTENRDTLRVNDDGANVMIGLGGNDDLNGGAGNDYLYGSAGVDYLYGEEGDDFLDGGEGIDFLLGNAGKDILFGNKGNDYLYGQGGNDTYVFRVGDGTDTIKDVVGDTMTLRFEGGDYGADDFTDTNIFVRDGNNLVITLDNDKITILDAYNDDPNIGRDNAAFTINIEYGTGDNFTPLTDVWSLYPAPTPDPTPDPANDFERIGNNLYFLNANGFNDFSFVRNVADVEITAGGVSEMLVDFVDNVYTLYYGSGKTELGKLYVGTEERNVPPQGDDGANVMIGLGGDDILYGGEGDDILDGGADNEFLHGGAGNDYLNGGVGDDYLYGNEGDDYLYGGEGTDELNGNEDNDFLYGGEGIDKLNGDAGNDNLNGGDGTDELNGGDGNDELYGNADTDHLNGGEGDDILDGGAGNDFLTGEAGEDILYGSAGNDSLDGNEDTDTYVFRVGDGTDTIFDVAGDTMILRFEGGDYAETDFTRAVFSSDGFNLVITLDKNPDDDIVDKITIYNAYDTDPNTGTGNAAFTIIIQYGEEGGIFTPVADIWSAL